MRQLSGEPEQLAPGSPRWRAILIVRPDRSTQPKGREGHMNPGGKEQVGGVVQALAARGIDAKVRVAPRRKDATRHARAAAGAGAELVVGVAATVR